MILEKPSSDFFQKNRSRIFTILIIISVLIRLLCSQIGYNYDLTSWKHVGEEVLIGRNFYVNDDRFPYGPILSFLFAGLILVQKITGNMSMAFFHLEVVVILTVCDLLVYKLLSRDFDRTKALFFILNPISIFLTGFHSQVEIIAILIGYLAWNSLLNRNYWLAGIMFGVSIGCKHVLFFFPIVLLFVENIQIKERLKVFFLSYFILVSSIWLYSSGSSEIKSAVQDIFSYSGAFGENGLLVKVCYFILPTSILEGVLTISVYKYIFIVLVLITTYAFIWIDFKKLFFVYLFLMFTFSSSLADQHMILPLFLAVAFPTNFYFWMYTFLGSSYLFLMSHTNVAPFVVENILHRHFTSYHGGWFRMQFWLILFLLQYYFKDIRRVLLERFDFYLSVLFKLVRPRTKSQTE